MPWKGWCLNRAGALVGLMPCNGWCFGGAGASVGVVLSVCRLSHHMRGLLSPTPRWRAIAIRARRASTVLTLPAARSRRAQAVPGFEVAHQLNGPYKDRNGAVCVDAGLGPSTPALYACQAAWVCFVGEKICVLGAEGLLKCLCGSMCEPLAEIWALATPGPGAVFTRKEADTAAWVLVSLSHTGP